MERIIATLAQLDLIVMMVLIFQVLQSGALLATTVLQQLQSAPFALQAHTVNYLKWFQQCVLKVLHLKKAQLIASAALLVLAVWTA